MKKTYIVISVISLIILVSLFVVINLIPFIKKDKKELNSTEPTTKLIKEETKVEEDKLFIEGIEETIYVANYLSHLGFSFKYETNLFNPVLLSNSSVEIDYKEDSKNKIIIEKLTADRFNKEFNELTEKSQLSEDNYITYYFFLTDNSFNYLKITKSIYNSTEFSEGLDVRMDYIINSLSFN